ncbi:MAG TPA: hypothetical protein VFH38_10225 [Jatrophihabitans sp.]|nr:hypothetical protein [Jatrophihabitans sp.]
MRTTDVGVQQDDAGAPETGSQRASDHAESAAIQAAKAASRALRAKRHAEPVGPAETPAEAPGAAPAAAPHSAPDSSPDSAPGNRSSGRGPLLGAVAALVACLAFAASALVVHLGAGSGAADAGAVRDAALLAARQDIVVLNTLDYRKIESGLQRWSDASTGALHAQLARVSTDERKRIAAAQAVTTAKVLDAAVVNLDAAAGSATVIASVELTVHPVGKPAQLKRERLRAQLVRVGDTWKVSALDQVGVTLS